MINFAYFNCRILQLKRKMLFVYSDTDIPTISFYANNRDVNLPELALGLFCPGILKGKFCGLKKLQNQKISVLKFLKFIL